MLCIVFVKLVYSVKTKAYNVEKVNDQITLLLFCSALYFPFAVMVNVTSCGSIIKTKQGKQYAMYACSIVIANHFCYFLSFAIWYVNTLTQLVGRTPTNLLIGHTASFVSLLLLLLHQLFRISILNTAYCSIH